MAITALHAIRSTHKNLPIAFRMIILIAFKMMEAFVTLLEANLGAIS